jgi:SPP1 family predicted phage head-tail adaptor
MRAGRLRHRIALQSVTGYTQDDIGGEKPVWTTYATVWAAVEPMRGEEEIRQISTTARLRYKVEIRYRSGILAEHRILFGSTVLQIMGPPINVGSRNIRMELVCEEVTP